jgi:2-oxo-4-hydroxy-4-carboxy--5-ureidoimidazoline (OHCU) decarboxylase
LTSFTEANGQIFESSMSLIRRAFSIKPNL